MQGALVNRGSEPDPPGALGDGDCLPQGMPAGRRLPRPLQGLPWAGWRWAGTEPGLGCAALGLDEAALGQCWGVLCCAVCFLCSGPGLPVLGCAGLGPCWARAVLGYGILGLCWAGAVLGRFVLF